MAGPFDPENYYNTLTRLYSRLFGDNWHLGYWLNASTFADAGRRLNELMIGRLGVGADATVVDVGCGVGGPTCDIAEQAGCQVIGITNSVQGVRGAEALARTRGLDARVRFQLGDALALPFENASVDAVFSCEAVHNVTDKVALSGELARMLKPGGTLVVGDLFLLRLPDRLTIDAERLKSFSFHLFQADEWIEMLRASGLEVTELINIGHHVGCRSLAYCIEACRSQADREAPGSLEQTILHRTVEATTLLAEGFRSGDLGWGVWRGHRREPKVAVEESKSESSRH